ncbi:MAG TPA: hypothetical protein DCE42_04275 [Myxococcales bacterium]|nr:hypothetical protein [Deltaproteobacteria bacterium]MBU53725.1 hypothetical protein [Deltaproteobacteria bacterium]HAA53943.1 hypothetical protein [Myxococcales bacterium]
MLPKQYSIWLDGLLIGKAPVAYLRIDVGLHELQLGSNGKKSKRFRFRVRPGYHTTIATRGASLGVRILRHEEVDVTIRSTRGAKAKESIRAAGRYCISSKRCLFMLPGEELYIRHDGRYIKRPSRRSLKNARNYRATALTGNLSITSFPPGVLFLNGRPYAPTPLTRLPLSPGRYKATIKNTYMGIMWRGVVTIRSGKTTKQIAFLHPFGGGSLQIQSRRPVQIFLNGLYRGWSPALTLPLPVGYHKLELRYPNGKRVQQKVRVRLHQRTSLHFH